MNYWISPGAPGTPCDWCGDLTRPMLIIVALDSPSTAEQMCVVCMAQRIDSVTGWRLSNQCRQALAVGRAGERFHHPERFVKPPRRYNRQERLDKQN